jgi:hypothetical protein
MDGWRSAGFAACVGAARLAVLLIETGPALRQVKNCVGRSVSSGGSLLAKVSNGFFLDHLFSVICHCSLDF